MTFETESTIDEWKHHSRWVITESESTEGLWESKVLAYLQDRLWLWL